MRKSKKLMAFVLSMAMVLSNVSLSTTTSYAEGPTTSEITSESTTVDDNTTETNDGSEAMVLTQDELDELLSEQDISTEELNTEDITSEDIATTETVVKDTTENTTEETTTEEANVIDATTLTYRLIVATENTDILTNGVVISNLDDLYIVGFATEDEREKAIEYYTPIADFVEKDDYIFESNDNTESTIENTTDTTTEDNTDEPIIENTDDAFTAYEELSENEDDIKEVQDISKKNIVIAVIDSGATKEQIEGDNILNAVSVIGDNAEDDFGHGSDMIDTILSENKDAKILSIKALNDEGKATASDIYTAIKYAIDNKVNIINLSLSAYNIADNSVVKDIIKEAIENKIIVVGSAGNDKKNVKYFIPGCIEEAYIISAKDSNDKPLDTNNFGNTIDYIVLGKSTSEATARFTGIISTLSDLTKIDTIENSKITKYVVETETLPEDNTETTEDEIDLNNPFENPEYIVNEEAYAEMCKYFQANWSNVSNTYFVPNSIHIQGLTVTGMYGGANGYVTDYTGTSYYCGTYFSYTGPSKVTFVNDDTNAEYTAEYMRNNCHMIDNQLTKVMCSDYDKHTPYGGTVDNVWLGLFNWDSTTHIATYRRGGIKTSVGSSYYQPVFIEYKVQFSTTTDKTIYLTKALYENNKNITRSVYPVNPVNEDDLSYYGELVGCQINMYTSEADAKANRNAIWTFTQDDPNDNITNGYPITNRDLETAKTFWFREVTAPTCGNVEMNPGVWSYTISLASFGSKDKIILGAPYSFKNSVSLNDYQIASDIEFRNNRQKYQLRLYKRIDKNYANNPTATDPKDYRPLPAFTNNPNYDLSSKWIYELYDENKKKVDGGKVYLQNVIGTAKSQDLPIKTAWLKKNSAGKYVDTTFYVKEVRAPKGYQLDSEFHRVVIHVGEAYDGVTQTVTVTDKPIVTNLNTVLNKIEDGKPTTKVRGARFRLCYYKANGSVGLGVAYKIPAIYNQTKNQYSSSYNGSPDPDARPINWVKRWEFDTDSNGQIKFATQNIVAGHDLYKDNSNKTFYPLGVYTLFELNDNDPTLLTSGDFEYTPKGASTPVSIPFDNEEATYTNTNNNNLQGMVFRLCEKEDKLVIYGRSFDEELTDTLQSTNKGITVPNQPKKKYYAVMMKKDINGFELKGVPMLVQYTNNDLTTDNKTVSIWPHVEAADNKNNISTEADAQRHIRGAISGYFTRIMYTNDDEKTYANNTNTRLNSVLTSPKSNQAYTGLTIIELGYFETKPTNVYFIEKWYAKDQISTSTATWNLVRDLNNKNYNNQDATIWDGENGSHKGVMNSLVKESKAIRCLDGKKINFVVNGVDDKGYVNCHDYDKTRTSAKVKANVVSADNVDAVISWANKNYDSIRTITNISSMYGAKIHKQDANENPVTATFKLYGTDSASIMNSDIQKWNNLSYAQKQTKTAIPSGIQAVDITPVVQSDIPMLLTGHSSTDDPEANLNTTGTDSVYTPMITDENGDLVINLTNFYDKNGNIEEKYKYIYAVEYTTEENHAIVTKAVALNIKDITEDITALISSGDDVTSIDEDTLYATMMQALESTTIIIENPEELYVSMIKELDMSNIADSISKTDILNNPNYSINGTKFFVFKSKDLNENTIITRLRNNNTNFSDIQNYVGELKINPDTWETLNDLNVTPFIDFNSEDDADWEFSIIEYIPNTVHGYDIEHSDNAFKFTSVVVTTANTEENPAKFMVKNKPVNDPFQLKLQKHDAYLNQDGVQYLPKGVTFEGTEVQLKYYALDINQNYTQAQLNSRTPDQVITLTSNANGEIQYDDDFPLGYITIAEVGAPTGYSDDPSKINYTFTIGNDDYDITDNRAFILDWQNNTYKIYLSKGHRDVTDQMTTATLNLFDPPIRKDITIKKVTEDNEKIEGVSFRIDLLDDNNRVVESKTITTNSQGIATTLNGGEDTWFTTTNDSRNTYPYNATEVAEYHLGSMPVGHYKVTELPSETNKTYQLPSPLYFEITGDDNEPDVIPVADYNGTIVNVKYPTIDTTASVTSTGTKQLPYGSSQVIKDHIVVDRLRYGGNKYTIVGTLKVVDENGDVSDYSESGEYTKTFTITTPVTRPATAKSEFSYRHEEDLQFPVTVNKNLEGKKLVVFLKLYYGTSTNPVKQYPEYDGIDYTATGRRLMFPLVHEDETNTKETVYVPKIRTHAVVTRDNGTEGKALLGKPSELVYDILEYENLLPNTTYTVKGVLNYAFLHSDDTSWKTINNDNTVTFTTPNAVGDAKTVSGTTDINGNTVKVPFTVNGENLAGSNIVLYERLYNGNSTTLELAKHEDMNDPEQQLSTLSIKTNAIDDNTNIQVAKNGETIFVDRVDIIGLEVGKTYRLTGTLYDANSSINAPSPIKNAQNTVITHTETFTADSETYELEKGNAFEMRYPIDISNLRGTTVVVFETLEKQNDDGTWDTEPAAVHKELRDLAQMVHIPEISTTAQDNQTGLTNPTLVEYNETATITDYINYTNLVPNQVYYIEGNIHEKDNPTNIIAEIKLTDNETYTPEGELTSVGASGRIPVNFTFNSTNISGKTLVAYEKLYVKVGTQNIEVASHTSEIDNNQTIKVANVTTHVLSDQGTHYTEDDGIHEFTDTVDYFNVVSGKNYIVRGQLYYNNSNPTEFRGQPVLDANGQPYKSDSGVFSANAIDGNTTVKYTVDTRDLTARHIVVYEDLYLVKDDNTEVLVASHHDIADKDQTFFISSIKTTATDDSTKIHVAKNGQTTLNDQVTVKGLVIGDKYRIKGCLMDANSDPDDPQKIVNAQGNAITSTYPNENGFTAEHIIYDETTEYINIPYPIDVTNMDGTTIVIFEVLEHWDAIESKWEVVAEHQDIADIEQFVHIPSMSTSAKDSATGLTNPTLVEYNNTAKVTDTLTYGNLLPNQEYYIEGNIHEKGNPNNVIAKVEIADNKTFTPEGDENSLGVSGTIPVEFTFNSTNLKGKTLVIYEKLKVKVGNTEVEVADHTSELDMNQTIKVAQIETKVLSDQNTKYADSDGIHTFTDTVHYSNVIEGEKYRIRGQLYYNNDNPDDIKGTPVLDANGNEYKSVSEIFTADENGNVEMPYTIDTEPLAGRHIVVYEDLYLVKDENDETKDVHIAQHHNVTDYDQTFFIVNLKTKATDDNTNINVTMNGITTITDTVDYKGIDKNKNYIICGTLMERIVDETTGDVSYEPFKREDGTVYTADSGVFNSGNAINGTKLVKFVVNPTVLETDKTIVIFEKLYYIDEDHDNTRIEIAKHENINDIIQMAHIPHIHTLAMDKGTKLTDPTMTTYGTEIEVVDTVSYHNLLPNIEYTIKGELFELVPVVKEDEENPDNADENNTDENNADENANEENPDVDNEDNNDEEEVEEEVEMQIVSTGIVGEGTFTPKTTDEGVTPNVVVTDGEEPTIVTIDGTYPITFTFDSTKYADRTFVVYEKLYLTNTETNELVEIADHTDINDTKQTIHIPKITTEATDSVTGLHLGELREHITMDDVVSYTNVVPNNFYQVKGILMNKDTNEPYLDKNGEEVISYSEVFVPKTDSGDINVHYDFNIDLSELPTDKDKETLNLRLVVFEELYLVNDPSIEVEDEDDTNNDDTDNNDDANNDGNNDQNNDQNNNDANNENVDNNDANGLNGGQPINLDNDDDQNNDDLNNDDLNNDDNNDDQNNDDLNNDDNNDIDETPITQAQIDSANEIINAEFTEDADANLEIQKKINAYADEYGLPEDLYNKDAEFTEEIFNAVKNYLANFVEDAEVVDVDMTKPAKPIALVAIHKDIDDEGQTVNFTTIRTTLTGIPEKEVHETKADEEIELVDYVYYHNLLVGKTYTVSGILMKKPKTENEEPTKLLDKDGNEITAKSEPFTINSEEEVNGVVPITFKFDGSLLKGETTVAYEELYQDDIYVTSHKDITDEDQTVHMPKIGTMAFNSDTELQTAPVDKKVNITDTVMFENLVYGNTYVLTGSLMDKETGEVLKDNDGKEIVATQTFTVSEEDKNVTIEEIFANDGLPYEENTDVEDTDIEETTDEDDTDETEDTDDENAEDIDGNEVDEETVKVIRTKTHASGKVNVEFKNINTLNLVGKDTVVFEVLVNKDTNDEVADHKDKEDKDQNIKFPTVHTTALDKVDGDKLLDCRENTHTIVDTVHYTNLIPGKEYTLKAKVAIKPKNKSDKINFVTLKDKETYVTHTFIPEKAEGDEKVEITFDTSEYVTNNHLVVFEDLYYNDVLLYSHADIEDEDQTIFLGMQLEVQIGKADKDNIKYYLKDAEITIFNKDGTVAKDINGKECVGLTDTDGQIKFNVVYDPDNTYYAQETKAPKGYNINPDKFELKPTGEKNKLGADVIKITILDSIIIIPPKTPKTPKTSDIISIALVLALIGIGACGIIVFRKRKKNR